MRGMRGIRGRRGIRGANLENNRAMIAALLLSATLMTAAPVPVDQTFTVPAAGEAVAVIHASCERCDWGVEGREAAAVRILVDGKYSQHLLLTRGAQDADYHV